MVSPAGDGVVSGVWYHRFFCYINSLMILTEAQVSICISVFLLFGLTEMTMRCFKRKFCHVIACLRCRLSREMRFQMNLHIIALSNLMRMAHFFSTCDISFAAKYCLSIQHNTSSHLELGQSLRYCWPNCSMLISFLVDQPTTDKCTELL